MGKLSKLKNVLDMSTAARMQRAAEQGFNVDDVFTHRSPSRDVVNIDPNKHMFPGIFAVRGESSNYGAGDFEHQYIVRNSIDHRDFEEKIYENTRYLTKAVRAPKEIREELIEYITESRNPFDAEPSAELMTWAGTDDLGEFSWKMQELRGRVAMHMGADSVDMKDESGVSKMLLPGARSVNAAFDPKNARNKNDVMGAIDPRLLAPIAAGAGALVGAQAYDFGTPEYDAKIQEFRNRRAQKSQIWKELKEAGATIASAIPASIVSDAYRIGGYLSPVTSLDETEQGAQAIQGAMTVAPTDDNRFLNEIGRQVDQFGRDIEPLVDAWQQTPIYKGYKQLPERAQRLIGTASEYLF